MRLTEFTDYLDRQVDRDNLSSDTRRAYAGALRRFDRWYTGAGEPEVQDFQDYLLAASTGDVTTTEKSGASLNVEKCAFRKYLYVTGRSDEYDDLKFWFAEHFRASATGEPDHFTAEELDAIRAAASGDARLRALVAIFSETGARIGEVIRLSRSDIDFNPTLPQQEDAPAAITLDRQKRGEVVTDTRPLSQEAADAVNEYIDSIGEYAPAEAVGSDGLFVTHQRTPLSSDHLPSRLPADGRLESGEEFTWRPTDTTINQTWLSGLAADTDHPDVTAERMHAHLFRHTVGTRLGEAGYSAEKIGEFLGRASAAEEYVHLEDAGVVMDMADAAP